MSISDNKAVVQSYFKLFSTNQFDKLYDLLTDDFQLVGKGKTTNNHRMSKAQTKAAFEAMPRIVASPFQITINQMTAEENRVAVEAVSRVELRDGHIYSNNYVFLVTLRNGKICEIDEYTCTMTVANEMSARRGGPVEDSAALAAAALAKG